VVNSLRGLNVLVVDDNASARKIMSRHLRVMGFNPTETDSGEGGVEILQTAEARKQWVDLVLMDWRMPGMDGLATIRHIRTKLSLSRVPRIIMVTACDFKEVFPDGEAEKMVDGFLLKPVHPVTLMDAIMAVYGHSVVRDRSEYDKGHDVSSLAGARLLVVEDNEINQQVARELLEQVHIHVTIAEQGLEAVKMAGETRFDGILMDMQMPLMDGLEATRHIRQTQSILELPIIAMTANAMAGDRENCLAAGMNDHVAKPVVPEELYATLKRWIKKKTVPVLLPPLPVGTGEENNVALPSLPGITVAIGLRNVGGNGATYKEVLLKFAKNQGESGQRMTQQLLHSDFVALEQTAHSLKGVAATLGAKKLANLAEKIEKKTKAGPLQNDLDQWIRMASEELNRVVFAITTGFPVLANTNSSVGKADPEKMAKLFREAEGLLLEFDSDVEKVVQEMVPLVHGEARMKQLKLLQEALGDYNFELCLEILRGWGKKEGLELSH